MFVNISLLIVIMFVNYHLLDVSKVISFSGIKCYELRRLLNDDH